MTNDFLDRQREVLKRKAEFFLDDKLSLSAFLNDLSSISEIIQEKDKKLATLLDGYWWDLEIIHALHLDEKSVPSNGEKREIRKIANEILLVLEAN